MKTGLRPRTVNHTLKAAIVKDARFRNQSEFALKAQIPEGRLSAIIHGRVVATPDDQKAIARALRCSPADLFPVPPDVPAEGAA